MPDSILAILPEKFDLGFNLTGIDTRVCRSPEMAKEDLIEEMAEQRHNIILIDEKFFLSLDERLRKKAQESISPLIMAIPLKRSFKEEAEAKDYFIKMVHSAIGYEIRIT